MQKNNLHLIMIARIRVICIRVSQRSIFQLETNKWSFVQLFLSSYYFVWIQFFMTEPYACEPSSLPRYPPCKERDVKLKYEKHKRFGATLCIYCRYFLLFMESFNVWFFFRKSRVNGSVERHRNRQHASQNPGRRVFTPDANNKPQANPKVHMFSPFSSARI